MKRTLKSLSALTLLASLAMVSTQSIAGTLTVTESPFMGESVGQLQLPVTPNPPTNQTYWSGLLNITVSGTSGSFQGFCIDPFQWSSTTVSDYQQSSGLSSLNSQNATWVSNLYSNAFGNSTLDANHAAAFQIALWDLAKDDGYLTSGSVRFSTPNGANDTTVRNLASDMMDNARAGGGATQYSFSLYTSPTAQDYVVASVTAVPEPETYAMLLAGLGLMGFTVRRRRAAN